MLSGHATLDFSRGGGRKSVWTGHPTLQICFQGLGYKPQVPRYICYIMPGCAGALDIVQVNKQAAPVYSRTRWTTVKGQQRESTKRWYWIVSVKGHTAPRTKVMTQIHFPCRIQVAHNCVPPGRLMQWPGSISSSGLHTASPASTGALS